MISKAYAVVNQLATELYSVGYVHYQAQVMRTQISSLLLTNMKINKLSLLCEQP